MRRACSVPSCINLAFPSCAKIGAITNTTPKSTRQSLSAGWLWALTSWPSWGWRLPEETRGFFPGMERQGSLSELFWTCCRPGAWRALGTATPEAAPGVTCKADFELTLTDFTDREELIYLPVPAEILLWKLLQLHKEQCWETASRLHFFFLSLFVAGGERSLCAGWLFLWALSTPSHKVRLLHICFPRLQSLCVKETL